MHKPFAFVWLLICLLPAINYAQSNTVEWQEFSLGEPKLTISLPAKPVPMEVQVPFDMINHIRRFDTYRLYYDEGKVVAVFKFADYNIPITAPARNVLQEELSKLLSNMKAMSTLQKEKAIKTDGFRGYKVNGNFELDSRSWSFEDQLFLRDGSMWHVWIAVEGEDAQRKKLMQKILKSIGF